jgi:hypothetical protein
MRKHSVALCVLLGIAWGSPATAQFDITARVTVDNAYAFGWGNANSILPINYWPQASTGALAVINTTAGDIYNCVANPPPSVPVSGAELYPNLHPTITDYLYVVAFSDLAVQQGAIGSFKDNISGQILGSGNANWQVFATGVNTAPNQAPTLAQVNAQIALANNNLGPAATSSVGWVGPSAITGRVGHLVTTAQGGSLPAMPACIDPIASWMWYQDDLDPRGTAFNAFTTQPQAPGITREFLIFRLPVQAFVSALLKVCKVAGPGVAVGTPFTFTAGSSTFTVPAGPPPGGTCVIGPSFTVGSTVAVVETIPAGDTVANITVAPPSQLLGTPNLAGGSVNVTLGSGVTEVTFTDKRTGFVEICKNGNVQGNFNFTVNPGNLGPFVVPAGACSPAIEVAAGPVFINELPSGGATMAGCATIPSGQQGLCNLGASTSTVTVAPGDVSTMTIAFITNK